ncbi:sigma-70 family RNA polymerase sigma factor [Roseixanthobacter liquoris]|uniref:sigma-70 family RNA polymerase sigma factor n=1 Tax=Roseixanthobacter liquoris TaxID=3119921 RepID=UPI0037261E53
MNAIPRSLPLPFAQPFARAAGALALVVRRGRWVSPRHGLARWAHALGAGARPHDARPLPAGALSMAMPGAAAAPARPDAAAAARFQHLILPHLDAAYNLARFLSRDGDAAQDIVQDAFLRAFRGFADYRGGNPQAWLLAIVRNCYRDWQRARRKDHLAHAAELPASDTGAEAPALLDLLHDGTTPETALLTRTEAEAVRAVLDHLPEVLKEVLVLRELEDLSYREIATVTDTPIGTVMSRLARARSLFGTLWQRRAATLDGTS